MKNYLVSKSGKQSIFLFMALLLIKNVYAAPTIDIVTFFSSLNDLLIPAGLVISFFLIAINGYKIMTSQGDPSKVSDGQQGLTAAVLGAIFIMMAATLTKLIISGFFDVTI